MVRDHQALKMFLTQTFQEALFKFYKKIEIIQSNHWHNNKFKMQTCRDKYKCTKKDFKEVMEHLWSNQQIQKSKKLTMKC